MSKDHEEIRFPELPPELSPLIEKIEYWIWKMSKIRPYWVERPEPAKKEKPEK